MQQDDKQHAVAAPSAWQLQALAPPGLTTDQAEAVDRWIAAIAAIAATLPVPGEGECDDRVIRAAWLLGARPSSGFDPDRAVYVRRGDQARQGRAARNWDWPIWLGRSEAERAMAFSPRRPDRTLRREDLVGGSAVGVVNPAVARGAGCRRTSAKPSQQALSGDYADVLRIAGGDFAAQG